MKPRTRPTDTRSVTHTIVWPMLMRLRHWHHGSCCGDANHHRKELEQFIGRKKFDHRTSWDVRGSAGFRLNSSLPSCMQFLACFRIGKQEQSEWSCSPPVRKLRSRSLFERITKSLAERFAAKLSMCTAHWFSYLHVEPLCSVTRAASVSEKLRPALRRCSPRCWGAHEPLCRSWGFLHTKDDRLNVRASSS